MLGDRLELGFSISGETSQSVGVSERYLVVRHCQ